MAKIEKSLGSLLSEFALEWPTLDDVNTKIVCHAIELSMADDTKPSVALAIDAILKLSDDRKHLLCMLWSHIISGGTKKEAKQEQLAKERKKAHVAYKTEIKTCKEDQAHISFNYHVLHYLNKFGAFKLADLEVDVNDSRADWVLTKNRIRIPSAAFGSMHVMPLKDSTPPKIILANDLTWLKFTTTMDALEKSMVSSDSCLPGPGPMMEFFWKRNSIERTETTIYLSKKALSLIAESSFNQWSYAWKAPNGLVLCHAKGYPSQIRETSGYRLVYFSHELIGRTFVLEDVFPDWHKQTVVTTDELIQALSELSSAVREREPVLDGFVCL